MTTEQRRDDPPDPTTRRPGVGYVPTVALVTLCVAVTVAALIMLYTLWSFWPHAAPGGEQSGSQSVVWLGWKLTLSRESLFFVTVAIAGMLGGFLHTLRSITWYIGNRMLRWSWIPFNLLLPIVGALGGTVFYLVLRAGLFSPSTSVDQASPFGFAAVAVLVGLFSEQALEKLRQVAANLFAERPAGEDHVEPREESTHRAASPPSGHST